MSDKEQAVHCPYCGAEMTLEDNEDVLFGIFLDEEKMYWYQCNALSCGIHSPANHTKAGAYRAAMTRWQEPNRVLTLDEVLEIVRQNADGYNHICWLEKVDVRCISTPGFLGGYGIHSEIYVNFDFYEVVTEYPDCVPAEEYGKTWRCWMRNPTAQEMAETPWEGETGDGHDE